MNNSILHKITYFPEEEIQGIELPEKFTFPFYYEPHPLTGLAAKDLQDYLENEFSENHNFGLDDSKEGLVIGKMFGVLVVQEKEGKLGYLSAFSGKLAGSNDHDRFVPPVFDMLAENSFFLKQEAVLNEMNREIEILENNVEYKRLKSDFEKYSEESSEEISAFKNRMKENKSERKKIREAYKQQNQKDDQKLEAELVKQSHLDQFKFRMLKESWKQVLDSIEAEIQKIEEKIENLKRSRREKSSALQDQLFTEYSFLNQYGKSKSLGTIFAETVFEKPPAAAGECAAPKLLQYAFLNDLKPIAFGEFWWGASPKSEVRKHKHFYPACSGKCRPILKHMLEGIETEKNPLLKNLAEEKQIEIIYEDDSFLIVNKPAELLSVPGIEIQDSVYTRLQEILHPVEPLIVHRLDMSTSGILVVAKAKKAHKAIQQEFLKRNVTKRYTALLNGILDEEEGEIRLPLRGDINDRPRQIVCFENGKKAVTKWKLIEKKDGKTKVHFWPLTGRTHQLRVHAAHESGLNAPIVGDDLYGTSAERLYLHAAYLEFTHPETRERVSFEVKEGF